MKQTKKRNCMVFEAPTELTEKARSYADAKMVSTSAVCRQALNEFLIDNQWDMDKSEIPNY